MNDETHKTLRDEFAMAAMKEIIAIPSQDELVPELLASDSYK